MTLVKLVGARAVVAGYVEGPVHDLEVDRSGNVLVSSGTWVRRVEVRTGGVSVVAGTKDSGRVPPADEWALRPTARETPRPPVAIAAGRYHTMAAFELTP